MRRIAALVRSTERRRTGYLLLALSLIPPWATGQAPTVPNILREFARLSGIVVWPGFRADRIPVALYDGQFTWLVRHPNPPPGFAPVADRPDVRRMAGHHEAVRANTSVELGGTLTATVLVDPSRHIAATRYAAVLMHETFHAFQRDRYPHWGGNEVELFTYPMDDSTVLTLRKLETESLRGALVADDPSLATCLGARFVALRERRFAHLPEGAVAYERGTELLEGLAEYVEFRATGGDPATILPADGFLADAVRERSYAAGTAIAVSLDRHAPGWMTQLDTDRNASLDGLFATALTTRNTAGCDLQAAEVNAAEAWASTMITDLHARRSAVRARVFTQPGWTAEFVSSKQQPFFPRNFDPSNVHVVGATEVVHTRWLEMGNSAGSLEVIGRDVLTQGLGPHPLFNGVHRVTVAGLPDEPVVEHGDSTVVIQASGLSAEFRGALIHHSDSTLVITVP